MSQSSTLDALRNTIIEIRNKGHYGNCQKNSQEYADWCAWIDSIKERLLVLSSPLSTSTASRIRDIVYDWDDWASVNAAIERIHALTHLIEDDVESVKEERYNSGKLNVFETTLHSYFRKRSLGNGGAGNVFLVERDDGELFALKILNKQSSTNTKKTKRFLREAAFCKQHSNIPLVEIVDQGFEYDSNTKRPFYVMPLYKESLRKLMENPEAEPSEILSLLLALISSLRSFYHDGHVHRDIKPENILFDESKNRLILADFGIAHIGEDLPGLTLETQTTERLANFKYAAPEQRIVNGEIDHRTDQFAFGLIINEMFTGAIPQGSAYAEISSKSERHSYLDPVIEKMISQNKDDRYESVSVLLSDIEARRRIKGLDDERVAFKKSSQKPFNYSIVSKEWDGSNLVFELNGVPDRDWAGIFHSHSYDSWCTDGFYLGPKYFQVVKNKILVPKTRGDKRHIAEVCELMPGFIDWTNQMMRQRVAKEEKEAYERMVRVREEEIKMREDNADINSFLATL